MNAIPTRRRFLTGATALLGAGAVAACTTSNNGGTITATLDVAKIHTDGSAIITALQAALAAPSLAVLLGANLVTAQAALVAAQAALAEFDALTGGSVTVSFDTTKARALVTSLLADAQTVLQLVQQVTGKLAGAMATTVGNYVAATLALIPFVQLAAGLVSARPRAVLMSESQALAIANGSR